MALGEDAAQRLDVHLGVDGGGFEADVAEEFLPVTASGNAAEGIPRGNIRGGRDPLAGGTRTGCRITPRTSHGPAG